MLSEEIIQQIKKIATANGWDCEVHYAYDGGIDLDFWTELPHTGEFPLTIGCAERATDIYDIAEWVRMLGDFEPQERAKRWALHFKKEEYPMEEIVEDMKEARARTKTLAKALMGEL